MMAKTIVSQTMSLDGFIAAPDVLEGKGMTHMRFRVVK